MSLVPALIAVFGVLVGIAVGYIQWRRNRELELEKLAWEREKLQLTQQLERERAAEDLEAERAHQLLAAEETERATRRATRRSSATDSELAEQYRHALVAELRNVKILDMSRPLDLEKIYVQMTICEEPQHFAREREIRQLAEEGEADDGAHDDGDGPVRRVRCPSLVGSTARRWTGSSGLTCLGGRHRSGCGLGGRAW
jgi:hypothetical protein